MTRAEKSPVRRVVGTRFDGELVAEVRHFHLLLRPLGTRRGGPREVALPWGLLYLHGIQVRVEEERREKSKTKRPRR